MGIEVKKEQFSWIIAAQKALKNTLTPNIVAIVALILTNPGILGAILGNWKDMTVLEIALYVANLVINWMKNRNLGVK